MCNGTRRCRCCSRGGGLDCPQGCGSMLWVLVSWCVAFRFRTRNRLNEKTACPIRSGGSLSAVEILVVRVFRPAHRPDFLRASHRGIFSNSSVGTLRLSPQEFLMLHGNLAVAARGRKRCVCHKKPVWSGGAAGSYDCGERLAACWGRFIDFLFSATFVGPQR